VADETSPVREIKFESLIEGCLTLERELGLPPKCLLDLPGELSDWSFVIKIATLVESAVTHLLSDEIGDERFRPFVSKLGMHGATGKLQLAKSLSLLTNEDHDFSTGITKLRNHLAHDPAFLRFELVEYLSHLTESDRHNFFKWATRGKEYLSGHETAVPRIRVQIWAQALVILAKANVTKATRTAKRRVDQMHKDVGESFMNTPPFIDETETE
jgi:hypothetical protein